MSCPILLAVDCFLEPRAATDSMVHCGKRYLQMPGADAKLKSRIHQALCDSPQSRGLGFQGLGLRVIEP